MANTDFKEKSVELNTVEALLSLRVKTNPNRVFLKKEDYELTYFQLEQMANRFGNTLLMMGMGTGDKVGIAINNLAKFSIGVLGTLKVGGVAVPLECDATAFELHETLIQSDPTFLVTNSNVLSLILPNMSAYKRLRHIFALSEQFTSDSFDGLFSKNTSPPSVLPTPHDPGPWPG